MIKSGRLLPRKNRNAPSRCVATAWCIWAKLRNPP